MNNICLKCGKPVREIYQIRKWKFFGKDDLLPTSLFDTQICMPCLIEFFSLTRDDCISKIKLLNYIDNIKVRFALDSKYNDVILFYKELDDLANKIRCEKI